MEFFLKTSDNVYPCEVTIDEDNGRYMIRKSDSSGVFFNSPLELVQWVRSNWKADDFIDRDQFDLFEQEMKAYLPSVTKSKHQP